MKLITAYYSGSVGVLSEGLHSFLDLISAVIAFFTIQKAGQPADENHPFGHGKIETLSSLLESVLLVLAAGLIAYEATDHFLHPHEIQYPGIAIAVIIVSILVSYFAYVQNSKAGRATESSAIQVNALHFLSDVVASVGILAGLILMKITGWLIIDPLIAVVVAVYILAISMKQVKRALMELSDTQLPPEEVNKIKELIHPFQTEMINAHDLRTRKSGAIRHIDFHLVVCGHVTVEKSHDLCDQIETKIAKVFPQSSINIHVEPCEKEQTQCHLTCPNVVKKHR